MKSTKSWDRLVDTGYRLPSTVTGGPKCIFLEEIRVWTGYLTVTGNQKEKEKGPPFLSPLITGYCQITGANVDFLEEIAVLATGYCRQ